MAIVYVKARPGRRAYYEGRMIPEDHFIPVEKTPMIRRSIEHWQDLEAQDEPDESEQPKPAA